jgi:DNA-binding NtrC family response regulator
VRPVGSSTPTKVDVRVVAATNVDLAEARAKGRFRDDLYFRLDVVKIALPPLRDRRDDILPLANHFLRKHKTRIDKVVTSISADAARLLVEHDWKGNVRELENVIERAVIMCKGETIAAIDLNLGQAGRAPEPSSSLTEMTIMAARRAALAAFDRRYLEAQMHRAKGNVTAAARASGMDRANFRRLLKRYRVQATAFTQDDD